MNSEEEGTFLFLNLAVSSPIDLIEQLLCITAGCLGITKLLIWLLDTTYRLDTRYKYYY